VPAHPPRDARDPLESITTRHILSALRSRGGRWTKMHGHSRQDATLDIIGCYRGCYVEIEVKRTGKKATPRQALIIAFVREVEGFACVAYDAEDAHALLDEIDDFIENERAAHDRRHGAV